LCFPSIAESYGELYRAYAERLKQGDNTAKKNQRKLNYLLKFNASAKQRRKEWLKMISARKWEAQNVDPVINVDHESGGGIAEELRDVDNNNNVASSNVQQYGLEDIGELNPSYPHSRFSKTRRDTSLVITVSGKTSQTQKEKTDAGHSQTDSEPKQVGNGARFREDASSWSKDLVAEGGLELLPSENVRALQTTSAGYGGREGGSSQTSVGLKKSVGAGLGGSGGGNSEDITSLFD
jgi:hypothetical protein